MGESLRTPLDDGVGAGNRYGYVVVVGGDADISGIAYRVVAVVAGRCVGDVERFKIIIGIVNAGDGNGLYRVPVAVGEGQCATDGRRIGIAAFRRDGDVVGWGGVEHHAVGGGVVFVNREGSGGQGDADGVIVGGGEGVVADRDAGVAATAGCVADGRGAIRVVVDVVVNAGDGHGLQREPVAVAKGQCATDGRHIGGATGGGDGDAAGGRGIKSHGVFYCAAVFRRTAAGGRQGGTGCTVVINNDDGGRGLCNRQTGWGRKQISIANLNRPRHAAIGLIDNVIYR